VQVKVDLSDDTMAMMAKFGLIKEGKWTEGVNASAILDKAIQGHFLSLERKDE